MRIVGEAAKKDSDFAKMRFELFSKQHAVIKDLHYAPTMKHDWLQWQQTVLDAEGHRSGSGQQRVREIIKSMPYAPTRAGVEADCYEVLCRTMKATLSTVADKVKKDTTAEVREAYKKTLDVMNTQELLRLGLNTDKKIIERLTLRRFDTSASFQPTKADILQNHMRSQWAMVHQGGLVSELNGGTMTRVVQETIRDNPTVSYGLKVRALSEDSLVETLKVEVEAWQRQSRVVNTLSEEHNNNDYFMNNNSCFDLCRWHTIALVAALAFPWMGPDAKLNHRDKFSYFCRASNVTVPNAK